MKILASDSSQKWAQDNRSQAASFFVKFQRMALYGKLLGDWKRINKDTYELRIHSGPGYRVYFSFQQGKLILLLCAGDKRTQQQDILKANRIIKEWRKEYG